MLHKSKELGTNNKEYITKMHKKKINMLDRIDLIISKSLISLLDTKDIKELINSETRQVEINMPKPDLKHNLIWKLKPKMMDESYNTLSIIRKNVEITINTRLKRKYNLKCPVYPRNDEIALDVIRGYIYENRFLGHEEFVILHPTKYICGIYTEDEDFIYVLNQDQKNTQSKYCVVEKFDKTIWKRNDDVFFYSSPIEELLLEN